MLLCVLRTMGRALILRLSCLRTRILLKLPVSRMVWLGSQHGMHFIRVRDNFWSIRKPYAFKK